MPSAELEKKTSTASSIELNLRSVFQMSFFIKTNIYQNMAQHLFYIIMLHMLYMTSLAFQLSLLEKLEK